MRATDDGPGIPDLDLVLSGRYRSRTGLGKGLLGTRRLAARFDVKTGPGGTTVEAEIQLRGWTSTMSCGRASGSSTAVTR